jgi:hypothetical protein
MWQHQKLLKHEPNFKSAAPKILLHRRAFKILSFNSYRLLPVFIQLKMAVFFIFGTVRTWNLNYNFVCNHLHCLTMIRVHNPLHLLTSHLTEFLFHTADCPLYHLPQPALKLRWYSNILNLDIICLQHPVQSICVSVINFINHWCSLLGPIMHANLTATE